MSTAWPGTGAVGVATEPPVAERPVRKASATVPAAWMWAALAACAAVLPVVPGLVGSRVFYIRDLSLYFWGRYLWIRGAWRGGEWPLWDPYVGGGQSALADALHQMFLAPAVLLRLLGNEVLGFNLWVAAPFPLAAVGAWCFLARRTSAPAATLGALAFALCGPVVSTGNFPNLSWSVAFMPWVLWATDAAVARGTAGRIALLPVAVAFQALAGEPVTLFATLLLAAGYAAAWGGSHGAIAVPRLWLRLWRAGAGFALGLALAAVQLIPLVHAAVLAERSEAITQDFWSLRPTALLETVWLHLYGNYFTTQSLTEVPWMPLMFTGREPFFFSIYFGVPLLALAAYGLAGTAPRWWRLFWVGASLAGLVAAFGAYTPLYPIFRDHVPLFGSFRFPVKFLLVSTLALAAGVAAGWDGLFAAPAGPDDARRAARARLAATGFAFVVGLGVLLVAAACLWLPAQAASAFKVYAEALGASDGTAAATFMVERFPSGALSVIALGLFAAVAIAAAAGREARPASRAGIGRLAAPALFAVIAVDLLVHAWGINPVFDPAHLAEPEWVALTRVDPHARMYVGGKQEGTLDAMDFDGSRAFLNPPGLSGSASRAAVSAQAVFYPSAWRVREMLSYDLAVLWPRSFSLVAERFLGATREERERFLDRTGARYRVLPTRRAPGREPLTQVPYFLESHLFDWGADVAPRVAVLPRAEVRPDLEAQLKALFEPGWDYQSVTLIEREPAVAGIPGAAVEPFARVVAEGSNWLTVEAGAGDGGGYLVVLDSYGTDWQVVVDGQPDQMVRANGLFRAVRLAPGRHTVDFRYRPRALVWGSVVSGAALLVVLGLLMWRPAKGRPTPAMA
jgi:hypothetical protein